MIPIDTADVQAAATVLTTIDSLHKIDMSTMSVGSDYGMDKYLYLVSAREAMNSIREKALTAAKRAFIDSLNSAETIELLKIHGRQE